MRPIDADKIVYSWQIDADGQEHDGVTLKSIIDKMPTIEPKHDTGEWIPYTYVAPDDWYQDKEIRYRCSKCDVEVINKSNFCPNCGVDMRNEERKEE